MMMMIKVVAMMVVMALLIEPLSIMMRMVILMKIMMMMKIKQNRKIDVQARFYKKKLTILTSVAIFIHIYLNNIYVL